MEEDKAFSNLSNPMKILFCCRTSLSIDKGAAKALIELAEELDKLGWVCQMISPSDLMQQGESFRHYPEKLREYLHQHAKEYDVVEYDNTYLPYPRNEFCSNTLFVTRCQLLHHHFQNIKIPSTIGAISLKIGWKSKIRSLLFGQFYKNQLYQTIQQTTLTSKAADLVILLNNEDKSELIRCGVDEGKIVVIPNGLSRNRRELFDAVEVNPPLEPKVAFVGTFDNRKGCTDFPAIVRNICNELPGVSFRLLGTTGLYRTKEEILAHFSRELRGKIEVIPRFLPDDLPGLLASCSVGIFPSYLEGFGLGVLEMLAASVPVIAYNSPGLPMMLPSEYLVAPGDTKGMSAKAIALLSDRESLVNARIWAREQSKKFCWQQIAKYTSQVYVKYWHELNEKAGS